VYPKDFIIPKLRYCTIGGSASGVTGMACANLSMRTFR